MLSDVDIKAHENKSALDVVPLWIGNRRQPCVSQERRATIYNPATGIGVRQVAFADAADIELAVAAAEAASLGWRSTPAARRARVLARFRDLLERDRDRLASLITEEHGKTLADARGSLQRGIEVVEFAVGAPHLLKGEYSEDVGRGVDSYSIRHPVGVCVGITPFNFPVMVPLWMFPMAIACGNTFILKPSEKVPSASVRMAELFAEAGLPDGVLNVIHGDRTTVDLLIAHPKVRAISFVGSTPVARHIYSTATGRGKRVQALGGAKNHAVILPDADLALAAESVSGAAFGSAGQRCMAISAVVTVGGIADEFVEKLSERAKTIVVGPGDTHHVEMGPVITGSQRDRVVHLIHSGVAEGASLVVDGRNLVIPGCEDGFYVGPTVFDHVSTAMSVYREEIFGPVLVVLRTESIEEAIELINTNEYGNGTAIFTRSGGAARRFCHEIEVGMVGVNVPIPVPMAFFSFGGWKSSLFGDLHVYGTEGVSFYTRNKVVTQRWGDDSESASLNMPVL